MDSLYFALVVARMKSVLSYEIKFILALNVSRTSFHPCFYFSILSLSLYYHTLLEEVSEFFPENSRAAGRLTCDIWYVEPLKQQRHMNIPSSYSHDRSF